VKLNIHLDLVHKLRMSGAVPLLLHTPSRSAGTAVATAVEGTVRSSLLHCFVAEQVSSSGTASVSGVLRFASRLSLLRPCMVFFGLFHPNPSRSTLKIQRVPLKRRQHCLRQYAAISRMSGWQMNTESEPDVSLKALKKTTKSG
jgi:hypothetical protein